MIEILICKNEFSFWDRKLVDSDTQELLRTGIKVDGQVYEVRKIHCLKDGEFKDFLYAVGPGHTVVESQVKNALGIQP